MALANSCQSMLTNIYKSFPSPTMVLGPRIIHFPFLSYWYDVLNPLYLHKRNIIEFKLQTNCLHLLATGLRDPKCRLKSTELIFSVFPLENRNLVGKHLNRRLPILEEAADTHWSLCFQREQPLYPAPLVSILSLCGDGSIHTLCIWTSELVSIPLNPYLYY